MHDVLVIGAGGHALSVAGTILASGLRIRAFVAEIPNVTTILGIPVVTPEIISENAPDTWYALAIGENWQRERAWSQIRDQTNELRLPAIIHPSANISPFATVSPGAIIMQGAIVGPGASVGLGCLINSGAVLEHESTLDDFASLAPGALTGGRVHIGKRTAISIGATIIHGVSIGTDTVIGAASLVNRNIANNVVAYGTPARVIRKRSGTDGYLTHTNTSRANLGLPHG